jgi:hypothetical protein
VRVVLGAAKFNRLSALEVSKLLETAMELGVDEIDTAPLYGESEFLIGKAKEINSSFRINTKVGLPNPELFSPVSINESVERSLNLLKIEKIGTLFIHTLPHSCMNESIRETLDHLVSARKVERIGYSGDALELKSFLSKENCIDDVMSTFNILDQCNRDVLRRYENEKNIYIKRPLANAVWAPHSIRDRLKILMKKSLSDLEYHERFDFMFSKRKNSLLANFALFPLEEFQRAKGVYGITHEGNLRKLVKVISDRKRLVDNPLRVVYQSTFEHLIPSINGLFVMNLLRAANPILQLSYHR